jgi:arylsulfatase A-like enzyme
MRLLSLFLIATLTFALSSWGAQRPNIIYILADDLGWADVGWHGGEIRTPHLDKLADGGAKLEQFYVLPVCTPTRAALMTGRYPIRHGLQVSVVRPWAQYGLPLDERTLPQALKEAGYTTHISGKWHLGHFQPAYLPLQRGFDTQYGHYNGAIDYFTHARDGGHDWHRNDEESREKGYATSLLGDEAVRVIEQKHDGKPFFLYLSFNAPHTPLQAPPEYVKRYSHITDKKRQVYAAMVECLDEQVGRVVVALELHALISNTLIIFSSDNGHALRRRHPRLRLGKLAGPNQARHRHPRAFSHGGLVPHARESCRRIARSKASAGWPRHLACDHRCQSLAARRHPHQCHAQQWGDPHGRLETGAQWAHHRQ